MTGVSFDIQTIRCEDGLNFIRVDGTIDTIKITDAMSDALDMDFSRIKVNNLEIKTAGNDCLDVSSGDYFIKRAKLENCQDKAFSAGEDSRSEISELHVLNANLGVAVKDSSISLINSSNMKNVNQCFSAYRKKQEYWGGKIITNADNCSSDKIFIESGSLLEHLE